MLLLDTGTLCTCRDSIINHPEDSFQQPVDTAAVISVSAQSVI